MVEWSDLMNYKPRHVKEKLENYIRLFPVVSVTGSRQSGKSTLLTHLLTAGWTYYSLDERGLLDTVLRDPDLFIARQTTHIIIDEAQKCPPLFDAIKHAVDHKHPYKFVLSGSANFLLLHRITESLAGRVGVIELYPFSYSELVERPSGGFLDCIRDAVSPEACLDTLSRMTFSNVTPPIRDMVFTGGYPKIWEYENNQDRRIWFENYRSTYIERDLRDIEQIADLTVFQRYYELLAHQISNLIQFSQIGSDLGISTHTSRKYFGILEASYQAFLLNPYFANMRKRLVRTPKCYLWDTGLAAFLLKLTGKEDLENSGRYGAFFENWVLTELFKQNSLRFEKWNPYFWRTSNGAEVDLLLEYGQRIIPIEIKSGISIQLQSMRGLSIFMDLFDSTRDIPFGLVIYQGPRLQFITPRILAVPVQYVC